MKKNYKKNDELCPEYDLRSLTLIDVGPGRRISAETRRKMHAARLASGIRLVRLDPDVAANFPTSSEVNEVLRAVTNLVGLRKKQGARKPA